MKKRTRLKSAVAKRGESSMTWKMVGTPRMTVHFSRSMTSNARSGSKPLVMTVVPPMCTIGVRKMFRPPVWNMGVKTGATSSGRRPQLVTVLMQFQTIWRCGSTAPLGWPVVPDV